MTCTLVGTAGDRQYADKAWATAWGSTNQVGPTDRSHYRRSVDQRHG